MLWIGSHCLSGGRLFRATPTGRVVASPLIIAIAVVVLARTPLWGPCQNRTYSSPPSNFLLRVCKGRDKFVKNPAFLDRLGPLGPCRPKMLAMILGPWAGEARLGSGRVLGEARTPRVGVPAEPYSERSEPNPPPWVGCRLGGL